MFDRIRVFVFWIVIILLEVIFITGMHIKIKKEFNLNEANNRAIMKVHRMISKELECFPVAVHYMDNIYFEDTYNAERENGTHEGCDILYNKNTSGVVPIISATDGIITNLGWLYLGGYRIGITSESGIYYYYAHFATYSPGLYVGKQVNAGEFLGFMGDTGEGKEGTKGKFPVHLHFGVYVKDKNGNEEAVNPYPFLLKINEE